jgi:DNA-directed RNA polymerase subunit E'/Rpb7
MSKNVMKNKKDDKKDISSKEQEKIKDQKKKKKTGIYMKNIITRKIVLPFHLLGNNVKENIKNMLKNELEGICSKEGYIKKNSINIITYSAGVVESENVVFDVIFDCLICKPVEGMTFNCIVKNITKAGIRAFYNNDESPVIIFIARDHHLKNDEFNKIKEDDILTIRTIGVRYQLNDENIHVLAELIKIIGKKKKKINIE